jgi:hypothetical protein
MHEEHDIEKQLLQEAERISEAHKGAPVVIIVGGSTEAEIPRCMLASTLRPAEGYRLRDLLGILQTAIQIETQKHFRKARQK